MNNDESEFDFGVPLEEDIERSPSPCEEIDAVNTETFGEDVSAAEFDDLEVYSKQTAGLKLDDYEVSGWGIEPSCSISAPDPSQLPDPTFESASGIPTNSHYSHFPYRTAGMPYSSSYELNLGTVDTLFENNVKTKNNPVWGAPDLSSVITKSAIEFINKREGTIDNIFCGNTKTENNLNNNSSGPRVLTSKKPDLAEIPKNALTVEELERQQLEEARSKNLPGVPQGAIALEDLERQILNSGISVKKEAKPLEVNVSSEIKATPKFPLSPLLPLSFPIPQPMMDPFMFNLLRARMAGQLIEPPGSFPLIPPQVRFFDAVVRNANAMGAFRLPAPPQIPGIPLPFFPSVIQASRPRMNSINPPVSPRCSFNRPNQNHAGGKNVYREPQFKKTGLPSTKTISDFAFDPYAGFMSKKEREWLIKIQVLQCQGTGNPFEDDYYYTAWRDRKLALRKSSNDVSHEKADCDMHATVSSAYHYVPPTFVGSLGKPSLSTVNNPRQLIDLRCDGGEEDDRTNIKVSSQKRFRALLMLVENIAAYVLACEDRKRQLNSIVLSEELRAQLDEELKFRLEALSSCLCSERLPTVISLNKGRHMLVRTFALLDKTQQLSLFKTFVSKSMPTALKVVTEDELLHSLLPTFVSYLMQCSKEDLLTIFRSFIINEIVKVPTNLSNKFLCNLILMILFCLSRKRIELGIEGTFCALYSYLYGRIHKLQLPDDWHNVMTKIGNLNENDFSLFRTWLHVQFQRYPGSVGSILLCKLQSNVFF